MSIISEFTVFKEIDSKLVKNIKIFYKTKKHLLFVTLDDNVYHYNLVVKQLKQIEFFCENQTITKFDSFFGTSFMALTDNGVIYNWIANDFGQFVGQLNNESCKPKKIATMNNYFITDFCCGKCHGVLLTSECSLFGFYSTSLQLIPIEIKQKITSISCGYYHTIALSDRGEVFGWGSNAFNQLGSICKLHVQTTPIKLQCDAIHQIQCGAHYTSLLRENGSIYFSGYDTNFGQTENILFVDEFVKFKEIATTLYNKSFVALTSDNKCFIFSKGNENCWTFVQSNYESIDETLAHIEQITRATINVFKTKNYMKSFTEHNFLGNGGFATVFNAEHNLDNRLYAVKKISFEPEKKNSILQEIKFLTKFKSEYVVKCFDSWIEENYYLQTDNNNPENKTALNKLLFKKKKSQLLHIQMELCPLTLRDAINIIKQEQYTNNNNILSLIGYYVSSELLCEILECVQYLHSQDPKVIHRDLKPENILLTNFVNNRFVKLSDFGISTFHEFNDQTHTKYQGTDGYKAPEIRLGDTKYSPKVDIYSLGCILQELFFINLNDKNRRYGNLLIENMNFMEKLIKKQLSYVSDERPDCDQVLSESSLWRLTNKTICSSKQLTIILENGYSKPVSKQNFIEIFITKKMSKYKNIFNEVTVLGSGGFSTVFKSAIIPTNKLYAIKKIAFDPKNIESVLKELNILSSFSERKNSYVVNLYDYWIEYNYYLGSESFQKPYFNNLLYDSNKNLLLHIQFELCSLTLRDVINLIAKNCRTSDKKLTLIGYFISSELLCEIIECVQYLHEQNPAIIHRDIKPENILLTNFENNRFVRLCDFGLSTFHNFVEQSHTKYIGTKNYRAAELNYSTIYTTKADIFSLGITILELFQIDINDENSIVSSFPLIEIKNLVEHAISNVPNLRPDCNQMLSQSNKWRLKSSDLWTDEQFNEILLKTPKSNSIEENFIEFFIQNKYKHCVTNNEKSSNYLKRGFFTLKKK